MRDKIKLVSSAGTGHYYTTTKNKRNQPEKMEIRKFDPVVRKHVAYKEAKIKSRIVPSRHGAKRKNSSPRIAGVFYALAGPVGNPALAEIVGRQLYGHLVAAQNSNIVFSHLAGDMCRHNVPIL